MRPCAPCNFGMLTDAWHNFDLRPHRLQDLCACCSFAACGQFVIVSTSASKSTASSLSLLLCQKPTTRTAGLSTPQRFTSSSTRNNDHPCTCRHCRPGARQAPRSHHRSHPRPSAQAVQSPSPSRRRALCPEARLSLPSCSAGCVSNRWAAC